MACKHKFIEYLTLERLDFEPTTLIVGTFNPEWPEDNYAEWFYGRTSNNYFWNVLPRMYSPDLNLRQAGPDAWKKFCSEHKVAITDLITSIQDADKDNPIHQEIIGRFSDKDIVKTFHDIEETNIVGLLKRNTTIKQVYLTRQPGFSFYDSLWNPIKDYCTSAGIYSANLLTPSASARFQVKAYKIENPDDPSPLRNFIYHSWKKQWINPSKL
jgi:hypothetical protein